MRWPNGAKSAFALGFDMDGDTIWRNKTKTLPGGSGYIKGPSIGQYGTKKGALRVLEILDEFSLKSTWFIPANIVMEHPGLVETILDRGHEIGHHGLDHTGEYGATFQEQRERIERCQEIFEKYTGRRALGFRPTGALLPETERWIYSEGGFVYSSAGISGEACGWYEVEGEPTGAVNIPCRDEQMDDYVQTVFHSYPAVLVGMPRIAPYENAYSNWVREVEGMVRMRNSGSTAFHPQIAGTPGRAVIFRSFCEYLASNRDIWCATCLEIADYYKAAMEGNDDAH